MRCCKLWLWRKMRFQRSKMKPCLTRKGCLGKRKFYDSIWACTGIVAFASLFSTATPPCLWLHDNQLKWESTYNNLPSFRIEENFLLRYLQQNVYKLYWLDVFSHRLTDQELLNLWKNLSLLSMEKITMRKMIMERQVKPPKREKQLQNLQLKRLQTTTGVNLQTMGRFDTAFVVYASILVLQYHCIMALISFLQLKDLTVAELKSYLTAHNLPVAGKKEALISRILTHMGKWTSSGLVFSAERIQTEMENTAKWWSRGTSSRGWSFFVYMLSATLENTCLRKFVDLFFLFANRSTDSVLIFHQVV